MPRIRRARGLAICAAGFALVLAIAGPASGRPSKEQRPTADLDGKPIELSQVGSWYCHDFDYPVIHCFSEPAQLEASSSAAQTEARSEALASGDLTTALAGVTYLTIYEFTTYQGAYMHLNENYSLLSLIGWNDRISSFKVRNSMSGAFWTDWLYSGTKYNFCCNQQLGSLGGYNDTFSSVYRN